MKQHRLVIEGNAVYEIDEDCEAEKEKEHAKKGLTSRPEDDIVKRERKK